MADFPHSSVRRTRQLMKKKRIFSLLIIGIGLVAGCVAGGPPPPSAFRSWEKPNVSPEGVKAALVQCGFDNPYSGFDRRVSVEDVARAGRCMTDHGFRYLYGPTICQSSNGAKLAACQ